MPYEYSQSQDRCCLDDLLHILKGPDGNCCDKITDALEYVRTHLEPVQSTGGNGNAPLSKKEIETRLRAGRKKRKSPFKSAFLGAPKLAFQAKGQTEEERVSLAEYKAALEFKPSPKSMKAEINKIKKLMVDGKFDEVTVLADNIVAAIAAQENAAERLLTFKAQFLPFMYAILGLSNNVLRKVVDYNLKVWGIAPATQIVQVIVTPHVGVKVPSWFPVPKNWEVVKEVGKKSLPRAGLVIAYEASKYWASQSHERLVDVPQVDYSLLPDFSGDGSVTSIVDPQQWQRLKQQGKIMTAPEHHGVYLGFGLISEVGPSTWCKHETEGLGFETPVGTVAKVCLTLATLHDFVTRAGNIPGGIAEIFRVKYDKAVLNTDNMNILKEQIKRALDMAFNPNWNYKLLQGNCQHWSSVVVTGDDTLGTQFCSLEDKLKREYIPIKIPSHAACGTEQCLVRPITDDGDVCATEIKRSRMPPFKRYCDLPSTSPVTGENWGYVTQDTLLGQGAKRAYGCVNPPLGTEGSKFYPCIEKGASRDDNY